jgi:hypothetical protein
VVAVRLLGVLLLLAVVVLAPAWTLQRRLIYLPSGAPEAAAEEVLDGGSAVRLHTADGLDLSVWHAPATRPASGTTVLVRLPHARHNDAELGHGPQVAAAVVRASR